MSRQSTSNKRSSKTRSSRRRKAVRENAQCQYREACLLASEGQHAKAKQIYERLRDSASDAPLLALVRNDLAMLSAVGGDVESAIKGLQVALTLDPNCHPARLNLALLEVDRMVEGQGLRAEGQTEKPEGERSKTGVERQTDNTLRAEVQQSAGPRPSTLDPGPCPKCLLLMITYNRLEYTRLAIEAVLQLEYPALELVVWDNASTDGTIEFLKNRLNGTSNVRLVLSETNRGVVYPMNAVWFSEHDAEVLAKVDNDTLVPPDLLRRLVECHVQSCHFGALSGFHFRREGEAIADPRKVTTLHGVHVFRQKYVGGCAIMVRREVLNQIGQIPLDAASTNGGRTGKEPFLQSGWTWYQERMDELGYINGYPWPFEHVDHMEDIRSEHCIRSDEHQSYKRAMRGLSLEEFTQELCVWKPH